MKRGLLVASIAALIISSCGKMPYFRSGAALGRITFATGDGSARSSFHRATEVHLTPKATAMTTDSSMDYVSDFYAGYGSRIGTFTPSNVVLPIELGEINLNDEDNPFGNIFIRIPPASALDDPAQFVADFSVPIASQFVSLPQGTYDKLELRFLGGHGVHVGRGDSTRPDYTTWTENNVTVEIPTYGGELSDIASRVPAGTSSGDFSFSFSGDFVGDDYLENLQQEVFIPEPGRFFERKSVTGDTFSFTLQYLFPRQVPSSRKYQQASDSFWVGWHVFTTRVAAARSARDREFDYNTDTLLMPLDAIEVSSIKGKATVVVSLDTTDLIEVYDNNTPVDKTDDIVVLADKYWERFTVILLYED